MAGCRAPMGTVTAALAPALLAAVLAVAAPAQAIGVHLGVGPGCAGVLFLAPEGRIPEGTLCARNGVVVSAESQEYALSGHALRGELHAGTAGTLFLLLGDREADPSSPPAPGGGGNLADLPNPDLRIRAVLLAVATEDLDRDVDASAVHADAVVAEGEGPCPHLQRLDPCTIPLAVDPDPIPPTSHLELRLTTSNERAMAATVQVGGDEPSRIELPDARLVAMEETAPAPEPPATKESSALSATAALLGTALLAAAARRRA